MTEYEELMSRLTEMRGRYDSGFSSSDRSCIETLYRKLLGKAIRRTGCGDCYRDAFVEIFTYLKKIGTMPTKPNYILKAGVVVHPKGTNQFYANANIPDEIAEKHLAEFPNAIVDFQSYPSDYLARVEARKNGETPAPTDTEALTKAYEEAEKGRKDAETKLFEATEELKAKTEELDIAQTELASLKAELETKASASSDDGSLSVEVETLKADLEAANEEIAKLKAELEKNKSASTSKRGSSKSAE